MAELSRLAFWCHLRAEPNQYILHYSDGKLTRKGPGLAYWFLPLSASVAQVPVEDCETTFMLNERSSDFQDLMAQCTVRYRFAFPEKSVSRINFTISQKTGRWVEEPLERLAQFWSQRAQHPARSYLTTVPVVEAIRSGAEAIRSAIEQALKADTEVTEMGLVLVSVQVVRIAPSPELEKAMQTPTREGIQQKADEAVFSRRAQAVEKERAIKENELSTQVELAKREEELIKQQGANELRKVQQTVQAEQAKAEADSARKAIASAAYAQDVQVRAQGDAEAKRMMAEAETQAERARMEIYKTIPSEVLLALALREAGQKIQSINHLNVTPDLVGQGLQQLLREASGEVMLKYQPRVVVVTRKTQFQLLEERHGTRDQARYYARTRRQSTSDVERNHQRLTEALHEVQGAIPPQWRRVRVDRDDLDRFVFEPEDVIVVVGQDGLVPNAAKYLDGQVTIGINPDPESYDGVLCPHGPSEMPLLMQWLSRGHGNDTGFVVQKRTMVLAEREDGQRLLALNEVFIGHRTHQSARYRIIVGENGETQSSSGLICATGTGATGWARSIAQQRKLEAKLPAPQETRLAWFVREPFPSKKTGTAMDFGVIDQGANLTVVSLMPDNGVAFADGIESDTVEFLAGQTLKLSVASQTLNLAVRVAALVHEVHAPKRRRAVS